MLIAGAGPTSGPASCLAGILVADRILRALVENHEDVAAECKLHIDRGFRGEGVGVTVQVRVKDDSLFGDPANSREAEHLKSTRIGKDRPRPRHETVQSA